jgi:hypothetical protein
LQTKMTSKHTLEMPSIFLNARILWCSFQRKCVLAVSSCEMNQQCSTLEKGRWILLVSRRGYFGK